MPRCACELTPEPIQEPLHRFHEGLADRLRAIAEQAPRYIAAVLHRRTHEDPERDAIVEQTRMRLMAIHETGRRLLPTGDAPMRSYGMQRRPEFRTTSIKESNDGK